MGKKYQPTELDRVLQQSKQMFPEWTNENQLEYQLQIQKEFHQKQLERMSIENSDLYVETVLLKRQIRSLQSELDELKLNNK